MASLNEASLIGNLGADPEYRVSTSGVGHALLRVATTESWTDKETKEKKEATEWHRIVLFGRLAEIARDYLKKGAQVWLRGSIKTRKWVDKEGVERYSTEIHGSELKMLDKRRDSDDANGAGAKPKIEEAPKGKPKAKGKPAKPKAAANNSPEDENYGPAALDDVDIPL
jgi:single-strand DNA-binding protein